MSTKNIFFLCLLGLSPFVSIGQNRYQVGLIQPMNAPVLDIETKYGTYKGDRRLFTETHSPDLQFGLLMKKFGKVQTSLKFSSNIAERWAYATGPGVDEDPKPATLDQEFDGTYILHATWVNKSATYQIRNFQLGYLLNYEMNKFLSFGTGVWLHYTVGSFSYDKRVFQYKWDGEKYAYEPLYIENSSSEYSDIRVFDRKFISSLNLMLPLNVQFTCPLKSGKRLGLFCQANLGKGAQNLWLGTFFEF